MSNNKHNEITLNKNKSYYTVYDTIEKSWCIFEKEKDGVLKCIGYTNEISEDNYNVNDFVEIKDNYGNYISLYRILVGDDR